MADILPEKNNIKKTVESTSVILRRGPSAITAGILVTGVLIANDQRSVLMARPMTKIDHGLNEANLVESLHLDPQSDEAQFDDDYACMVFSGYI